MTGEEHYRRAEQLLDSVDGTTDDDYIALARAQVHANLAVAAAVALVGADDMPEADGHAWRYAAGTKLPSGADPADNADDELGRALYEAYDEHETSAGRRPEPDHDGLF